MKRKIVAGLIIGVVMLSLFAAAVFKEEPVLNRAAGGADADIGIVDITGVITTGGSGGFGGDVSAGSQTVISQLQEARENPNIKAVVLHINSPGGSAAGSLEIGSEIKRLRQSGKKVVAYMGDIAASGAYWISCETDSIVANPATITGSIGVIMQTMDLQGLYDKLGIDTNVYKSGPHKDMGSASRDVTEEERAIFQSMIDDIYQQFVTVVANGRNMDVERVKELADGRIYTGRQALELGLVDELGDMHRAIQIAAELAGVDGEPSVVDLSPRTVWDELFGQLSAGGKFQLYRFKLPYFGLLLLPEKEAVF
ncbi:protease-4 [Desulfohalotomaculum tongense]|uniref:signal peptide peptidase SppA n=1 Tax=Desulforadius tongensis TaxID=1216062 RepID=UPI00195B4DB2|nr:signal peptide peptidase SppA [Desulforadius tongensis]MBM7853760.1 protease-4 [Desulforadius tongensis]